METDLAKISTLRKPENPQDYRNSNHLLRRWRVFYGDTEEYYLTDEEKSYFLSELKKGAKFVLLGELVLSYRFKTLWAMRKKPPERFVLPDGSTYVINEKRGNWQEIDSKTGELLNSFRSLGRDETSF